MSMRDEPMQDGLDQVLIRTRQALMSGDFGALAGLVAETESALTAFSPADSEAVIAIRGQAEGNATCLSAALAGLRAARARMVEIDRMRTTIGYDDKGQRRSLGGPEGLARRL